MQRKKRKKVIPIALVHLRKSYKKKDKTNLQESNIPSINAYYSILESLKNNNIQDEYSVKQFLNQCGNYDDAANTYLKECINILNTTKNKSYNREVFNTIYEYILPKYIDLEKAKEYISETENEDYKVQFDEKILSLQQCDRMIDNYDFISKRFSFESDKALLENAKTLSKDEFYYEAARNIASLIDTYNMPLRKKFAIALEMGIYLNNQNGTKEKNKFIIEGNTDYFLMNNDVITDKDYTSIINTLDTDPFFTDEDLVNVHYIFNSTNESFKSKIGRIAEALEDNNIHITRMDAVKINSIFESAKIDYILEAKDSSIIEEYKRLISEITNCKSIAVLKGLIKAAFTLMIATFVITVSVPVSAVISLICAIFSVILIIGCSPVIVVECIEEELKNSDKVMERYKGGEGKEIIKRYNSFYRLNKDIMNKVSSKDALREASDFVQQTLSDLDKEITEVIIPKDETMFDPYYIEGLDVRQLLEAELADSESVKELLNDYKAKQKKDMPTFQRILTKFFAKSPASIIDEFPDILSFIRHGASIGVLIATPVIIGAPTAILMSCTTKLIEMEYNRKEINKVIDHFKKEKAKCEKDYDKLKNEDKKEDLAEYIDQLDKCIYKLETYREGLYTDEELSKLDEATIDLSSRTNIYTFLNTQFNNLTSSVAKAIQIIRNEIIHRADSCVEKYEEYSLGDIPISRALSNYNQSPELFLEKFVSPNGLIDIPLGKIYGCCSEEMYSLSVEIASNVSNFIDKDFVVTSYNYNGTIAFTLNSLFAIAMSTNDIDNNFCENFNQLCGDIMVLTEMAEEYMSYRPDLILEDISSNLDTIVTDCDDIEFTEILCKCNIPELREVRNILYDYQKSLDCDEASEVSYKIGNMLNAVSVAIKTNDDLPENFLSNDSIKYINLIENTMLMREILNEAKKSKKKKSSSSTTDSKGKSGTKGKETPKLRDAKGKYLKNNLINKAKVNINKKIEEEKNKEKMPLSTTVKLAGQAASNRVKDASSKEKEVSKTIDAYAATIMKGCKDSLTSNRRESIIKGSIIPSFSRMIKAATAIGVLSIFNPALGAITAVGALAMSKYLTVKEKMILLEEIDVELKVIEKQIDKSEDDPKRYKQLLMYQRKLQRESQRIRYAVKAKGRDVPNPTD